MYPSSQLRRRNRIFLVCVVTLLPMVITCSTKTYHKGVHNIWRDDSLPPFEKGYTTQSEIIEILGPPSQIIALNDQIVFYYMLERGKMNKYFLGIYNWSNEKIRFDRAIFFLDENGVLVEHAYSIESVPYEEEHG